MSVNRKMGKFLVLFVKANDDQQLCATPYKKKNPIRWCYCWLFIVFLFRGLSTKLKKKSFRFISIVSQLGKEREQTEAFFFLFFHFVQYNAIHVQCSSGRHIIKLLMMNIFLFFFFAFHCLCLWFMQYFLSTTKLVVVPTTVMYTVRCNISVFIWRSTRMEWN